MRKKIIRSLNPASATRRSIAKSQACKLFYPFNEGSGNIVYENISGGYFTAASVNHVNVPHAPQIYAPAQHLIGGSSISVPYGKKLLWFRCIKVNGAYAQTTLSVGSLLSQKNSGELHIDNDSGVGIYFVIDDSETTVADRSWHNDETSPLEVVNTSGCTWDSVTKEMRNYSGRDGNGVTLTDIGPSASSGLPNDITDSVIAGDTRSWEIPPEIAIGFSPFPQGMYSLMLYVVDDLPSDAEMIEGLNWINDAHSSGHKELYPGWYGL